jgi:ATP-binding cassette subfamily B protein
MCSRPVTPSGGSITIGGRPIEQFGRRWLRRHIGIVLQEPYLYSHTIRENIASLDPGIPLEDVREAARIADIDSSIEEFEKGYDTMVGERGVTLSGGQKQRIAIARAIVKRPPILVFDDSLSAVDTQTDARIRSSLKERVKGTTTLLIAYRVTSLSLCDRILVLQDGRVAETGTHDELMALGGIYRKTYEMQESDAGMP